MSDKRVRLRRFAFIRVSGMNSFVENYVVYHGIPIPDLLCAFGLLLVRFFRSRNCCVVKCSNHIPSSARSYEKNARRQCYTSSKLLCRESTWHNLSAFTKIWTAMNSDCDRLSMRDKLSQYNTVDDAVNLIRSSRNILILTGAGISKWIPLLQPFNGELCSRCLMWYTRLSVC